MKFIRTKEKEEIDFCVVREGIPWCLVECKSGSSVLSPVLIKYTDKLRPKWSFQLIQDENRDRFYKNENIHLCSYEKFFSGLI